MDPTHKNRKMTKGFPLVWGLLPVLLLGLIFFRFQPVHAAEPAPTTVQITSISPSPAYIEQPVQIDVAVSAIPPAVGVPSGRVEIRSGQNRVCTLTLDAAVTGTCTLSFATPATVPLKAVYLGTNDFLPSVSVETTLLVKDKHTPLLVIESHLPEPSILNQPVDVGVQLTSDGPVPTGSVSLWRSNSSCTQPPAAAASDQCTASLASGAGSCSMPLTASGVVYLCAAYAGDTYHFPAQAEPADHYVSSSNSFTAITSIDPEPSLLGQTVRISFLVGSPEGQPFPSDLVRVTSGSLSCTATVADGSCQLTFTTPHLHDVIASYQGNGQQQQTGLRQSALLQPSISRVVVHRVNAPPSSIALSRSQVNSFSSPGSDIANISATDPNTDETHSYSLAAGAGSDHNPLFRISGSRLVLNGAVPAGISRLSIRIRATDPAGLSLEKTFFLQVVSDALLPDTGFAAGRTTRLLTQPAERQYQQYENILLEIPALGVTAEITGVPNIDEQWDTDWLWNQVGWLNGTAFPGWQGNSVLAAHNYLPSGKRGPFAQLHKLRKGDQLILHVFGETHVYEVRSVEVVLPDDSTVLAHETTPWITLVTCRLFDEDTGSYRWRVVVRAEKVGGQ